MGPKSLIVLLLICFAYSAFAGLKEEIEKREAWCKEKTFRKNFAQCKSQLRKMKEQLQRDKERKIKHLATKRKKEKLEKKKKEQEEKLLAGNFVNASIFKDEDKNVTRLKKKYNAINVAKKSQNMNFKSYEEIARDLKLYNNILSYEKRHKNGEGIYSRGAFNHCYSLLSKIPSKNYSFTRENYKELKPFFKKAKCRFVEPVHSKQLALLTRGIESVDNELKLKDELARKKLKENEKTKNIEREKQKKTAKLVEIKETKIEVCLGYQKLRENLIRLSKLKDSEKKHGVSRNSEKLAVIKSNERLERAIPFFKNKHRKLTGNEFDATEENCSAMRKKGSKTIYEVSPGRYMQ